MNKKLVLWEAIATMVGTVIGAGILGIPFVVAKAGFWTGISIIVFLGFVTMLLYLYLGEVALRTKGKHQLTGYAEKYLGKTGKLLMAFSMVFGIYGALIAYLIGVGLTLTAIFGGNPLSYSFLFFIVVGTIIYLGLKRVAESELYMLPLIILVVIVISILSFNHVRLENLTAFNLYSIFIPYGVILFAFLGSTAIPEMEMELIKNEKYMKRAIIIGMLIPIIIYLVFAIFVVGVSGIGTTEVATIGLGQVIGEHMVIIGNIFAVITMTSSFLALGLALQQMYNYDYKLSKNVSWALTCLIPLGIVIWGIATFAKALEISGILAGGLSGALIVLMAIKAKKLGDRKPEYKMPINWLVAALFIALFLGGAIYYISQVI
jgi:amino acid permease